MSDVAAWTDPAYAISKNLPGVPFEEAIERATKALAANGFGVLTSIDVKATLKKKIDVDTRPYTILGACNPKLAHQALGLDAGIGLLLPCNVVVADDGHGGSIVAAIDPVEMFSVVAREDIRHVAHEVKALLDAAIEAV